MCIPRRFREAKAIYRPQLMRAYQEFRCRLRIHMACLRVGKLRILAQRLAQARRELSKALIASLLLPNDFIDVDQAIRRVLMSGYVYAKILFAQRDKCRG